MSSHAPPVIGSIVPAEAYFAYLRLGMTDLRHADRFCRQKIGIPNINTDVRQCTHLIYDQLMGVAQVFLL